MSEVCRECGYPRAGLDAGAPCPECGTAHGLEDAAWVVEAVSRAQVALGLGALSLLGVVGCGVLGVLLGVLALGACVPVLAVSREGGPLPRSVRRRLAGAVLMGSGGIVLGLVVAARVALITV